MGVKNDVLRKVFVPNRDEGRGKLRVTFCEPVLKIEWLKNVEVGLALPTVPSITYFYKNIIS
jgi:hypothetical protein